MAPLGPPWLPARCRAGSTAAGWFAHAALLGAGAVARRRRGVGHGLGGAGLRFA